MSQLLFSFGTLRLPDVQEALFGRRVPATSEAIVGYRVGRVRITDPAAIAASGSDVHPALIVTGHTDDVVDGAILELSDAELASAHHYEEVSFRRIEVRTRSGQRAWAYVPKPELSLEPEATGIQGR